MIAWPELAGDEMNLSSGLSVCFEFDSNIIQSSSLLLFQILQFLSENILLSEVCIPCFSNLRSLKRMIDIEQVKKQSEQLSFFQKVYF